MVTDLQQDDDDRLETVGYVLPGDWCHRLYLRGFDFDVPLDATITGIEVHVVRSIQPNGSPVPKVKDSRVRLLLEYDPGPWWWSDERLTPEDWPDTDEARTYGSDSDTWGRTLADPWTPELVNLPEFGLNLRAGVEPTETTSARMRYDQVYVQVYYQQPCP
ncbi:MAG: hypothetical protein JRI23_14755 [Deltaproteobacteria bacterium]|jgi:hypothetical protein|nr:hypothetical protein [Deltaproteobacteria bacterium]